MTIIDTLEGYKLQCRSVLQMWKARSKDSSDIRYSPSDQDIVMLVGAMGLRKAELKLGLNRGQVAQIRKEVGW